VRCPLLALVRLTDMSSKRWIVDRATLKQARSDDLHYVENSEQLDFLNIYFGNRAFRPLTAPDL
jgi:hypothetical protein